MVIKYSNIRASIYLFIKTYDFEKNLELEFEELGVTSGFFKTNLMGKAFHFLASVSTFVK